MTDSNTLSIAFPNASIDMDEVLRVAMTGPMTEIPESAIILPELLRDHALGDMLVDAGGPEAVHARIDAAAPEERAAMSAVVAPSIPVAHADYDPA